MFVIALKRNGAFAALIDAPKKTSSELVLKKWLSSQGLEPDSDSMVTHFARYDCMEWSPSQWFGGIADIDTPFCELANKWYVGTSADPSENVMLSGPHEKRPAVKKGHVLWQRSEAGDTMTPA